MDSNCSTFDKRKKPRFRVPTSCTVCRRRKMRCDKVRPSCSSCKKSKTTVSCVYEDQPWSSTNEIHRLKEQNCLLRYQVRELRKIINGSNDNSNEMVFLTHFRNDPIINFSKCFRLLFVDQNSLYDHETASYFSLLNKDSFMSEMFSGDLEMQEGNFYNYDFPQDKSKLHSYLREVALCPKLPTIESPSYESSAYINLVEQVNRVLPKGIILTFLINHFFSFTYDLFPFLDEDSFRSELQSIITIDLADKVNLKIEEPQILSTVSLLLIILRLSFISLPLKAYFKEYKLKYNTLDTEFISEQFRKEIHIGPSIIELAKDCLSFLNWVQKPSLGIIQTLLMLKIYRKYAPENTDDTTDSSVILSIIIELARIHGLHRDPKTSLIIGDHAARITRRKIWHALLSLDAEEAYIKGYPLLIIDEYDTELPEVDAGCSHKEQIIANYLDIESHVTNLMRNIVKLCTIKIEVKRSEIEAQLEIIEDLLSYKLKSIESIVSYESLDQDNTMFVYKSKELILRLKVIGAKCALNRILYSSCEKFEQVKKKRYKKSYVLCALVILRMCGRFAENPLLVSPSNSIEFFLAAELASLAFYTVIQPVFSLIRESSNIDGIFLKDTTSNDQCDTSILESWLSGESNISSYRGNLIISFENFLQNSIKKSKKYFSFRRISVVLNFYHDFLSRSNPSSYIRIKDRVTQHDGSLAFYQNPLTYKNIQEKDILELKHFVNKFGKRDFDYARVTKRKLNNNTDLNDPYFKDFDDHLAQPYNEDYQKLQIVEKVYLCNVDDLLTELKLNKDTSILFNNYLEQTIIDWEPSIYDFYHPTCNPLNSPIDSNNEKVIGDMAGILFNNDICNK